MRKELKLMNFSSSENLVRYVNGHGIQRENIHVIAPCDGMWVLMWWEYSEMEGTDGKGTGTEDAED